MSVLFFWLLFLIAAIVAPLPTIAVAVVLILILLRYHP